MAYRSSGGRFGPSLYRSECGMEFLCHARGHYIALHGRMERDLIKRDGRWWLDDETDMGSSLPEAVDAAAAHLRT